MKERKKLATSTGHALLTAAEMLSAESRQESVLPILEYLEEQAHELPVVRRLFSNKLRMARTSGHPDETLRNDLWAGYGIVAPKLKSLTVLDEISDLNWSTDFDCVRLKRTTALQQIHAEDYDFVLIESAWLGCDSDWIYAFTSPSLEHAHSRILVEALEHLRAESNRPIVMINKEDPLHFEKFLPVMKYADHIFTTDEDMVTRYRNETDALSITALPFAANMTITNPVGRVHEPQENLCFAGSFYSGGYEERARQMNYMLEPIVDAKGVIYDRQSLLGDPAYYFPERFRPFIRPSVPFKEMVKLYRRFKVFLNVNTIVSSPTMMSRRVYELLASGTPVVSAPSRALEENFSGIVQTASTAREAKYEVERLLGDDEHWWRTSQKGIREIALKHQYTHRAALVRSVVWGDEVDRPSPLTSIVLSAERTTHFDRIIENIATQTYPRIEAVLALADTLPEEKIGELEKRLGGVKNIERVRILKIADSVSAATRLNHAIDAAQGQFVAIFVESCRYFPNYLTDMILTFDFSGADIAGKWTYPVLTGRNDRLSLLHPGCQHSYVSAVCPETVVARKIWLKKYPFAGRDGEGGLFEATLEAGGRIYSADHFNFIPEPSMAGTCPDRTEATGRKNYLDWCL